MADDEKIIEKLDEVIRKKKEEIESLNQLIGSIENPPLKKDIILNNDKEEFPD